MVASQSVKWICKNNYSMLLDDLTWEAIISRFKTCNHIWCMVGLSFHTLKKIFAVELWLMILQVKTPTIFLIGAQDLRVPMSNGLQVRYLPFPSMIYSRQFILVLLVVITVSDWGMITWLKNLRPELVGIFCINVIINNTAKLMHLMFVCAVCKGIERERSRGQNPHVSQWYSWNW